MNATFPRGRLVLAALLFSTGGAAIKAVALTGWQVASFRAGIAALTLLALLPGARRGWSWSSTLVGCAYAITMVLFVLSNKLTTSANAIFLQSAAPLYLLFLSPWLLHERVGREDLWFVLVVVAGLLLFFLGSEAPMATAPNPTLGNLVAIASGVAWAFTLLGLRWLGARSQANDDAASVTIVTGNVLAFAACLPMALPVGHVTAGDVAIMLFLGIFQIAAAYVLVTTALKVVPALEASAILLVEPALNPIWSWILHGEHPSAWSLTGGALILAATLLKWTRYTKWGQSRLSLNDRGRGARSRA